MNTFGAHKIGRLPAAVKGIDGGVWNRGIGGFPFSRWRGKGEGLRFESPIPQIPQCAVERENTLITTTPAQIKPMPINAGRSSFCLNTNRPISEINTMPTPDHMA